MALPKRVTQDESELFVIEHLIETFGAEATVLAYVTDVQLYGEEHQQPVWPSHWTERTGPSVKDDFERWCWGTAWYPA